MRLSPETIERLAAEYALGTLRGPARRRLERIAQRDPAVEQALLRWSGRFARMDEADAATPPPDVWRHLEQRLFAPRARPAGRRTWGWLSFAAAVIAAAALALMLPLSEPQLLQPVAVLQGDPDAGRIVVLADRARRSVEVAVLRPASVPADRVLELWAVPADGSGPRSLGLVSASASTRLSLPAQFELSGDRYTALAVSVEPPGGSPTGAPTGPVIMSGELARRVM